MRELIEAPTTDKPPQWAMELPRECPCCFNVKRHADGCPVIAFEQAAIHHAPAAAVNEQKLRSALELALPNLQRFCPQQEASISAVKQALATPPSTSRDELVEALKQIVDWADQYGLVAKDARDQEAVDAMLDEARRAL